MIKQSFKKYIFAFSLLLFGSIHSELLDEVVLCVAWYEFEKVSEKEIEIPKFFEEKFGYQKDGAQYTINIVNLFKEKIDLGIHNYVDLFFKELSLQGGTFSNWRDALQKYVKIDKNFILYFNQEKEFIKKNIEKLKEKIPSLQQFKEFLTKKASNVIGPITYPSDEDEDVNFKESNENKGEENPQAIQDQKSSVVIKLGEKLDEPVESEKNPEELEEIVKPEIIAAPIILGESLEKKPSEEESPVEIKEEEPQNQPEIVISQQNPILDLKNEPKDAEIEKEPVPEKIVEQQVEDPIVKVEQENPENVEENPFKNTTIYSDEELERTEKKTGKKSEESKESILNEAKKVIISAAEKIPGVSQLIEAKKKSVEISPENLKEVKEISKSIPKQKSVKEPTVESQQNSSGVSVLLQEQISQSPQQEKKENTFKNALKPIVQKGFFSQLKEATQESFSMPREQILSDTWNYISSMPQNIKKSITESIINPAWESVKGVSEKVYEKAYSTASHYTPDFVKKAGTFAWDATEGIRSKVSSYLPSFLRPKEVEAIPYKEVEAIPHEENKNTNTEEAKAALVIPPASIELQVPQELEYLFAQSDEEIKPIIQQQINLLQKQYVKSKETNANDTTLLAFISWCKARSESGIKLPKLPTEKNEKEKYISRVKSFSSSVKRLIKGLIENFETNNMEEELLNMEEKLLIKASQDFEKVLHDSILAYFIREKGNEEYKELPQKIFDIFQKTLKKETSKKIILDFFDSFPFKEIFYFSKDMHDFINKSKLFDSSTRKENNDKYRSTDMKNKDDLIFIISQILADHAISDQLHHCKEENAMLLSFTNDDNNLNCDTIPEHKIVAEYISDIAELTRPVHEIRGASSFKNNTTHETASWYKKIVQNFVIEKTGKALGIDINLDKVKALNEDFNKFLSKEKTPPIFFADRLASLFTKNFMGEQAQKLSNKKLLISDKFLAKVTSSHPLYRYAFISFHDRNAREVEILQQDYERCMLFIEPWINSIEELKPFKIEKFNRESINLDVSTILDSMSSINKLLFYFLNLSPIKPGADCSTNSKFCSDFFTNEYNMGIYKKCDAAVKKIKKMYGKFNLFEASITKKEEYLYPLAKLGGEMIKSRNPNLFDLYTASTDSKYRIEIDKEPILKSDLQSYALICTAYILDLLEFFIDKDLPENYNISKFIKEFTNHKIYYGTLGSLYSESLLWPAKKLPLSKKLQRELEILDGSFFKKYINTSKEESLFTQKKEPKVKDKRLIERQLKEKTKKMLVSLYDKHGSEKIRQILEHVADKKAFLAGVFCAYTQSFMSNVPASSATSIRDSAFIYETSLLYYAQQSQPDFLVFHKEPSAIETLIGAVLPPSEKEVLNFTVKNILESMGRSASEGALSGLGSVAKNFFKT